MKKLLVLAIVVGLLSSAVAIVSAHDPKAGRTGRAEVRFLEGMIDHHQMALDMATDCLAKAETDSLKTLCQNVLDTQSAEIVQMQTWLLEWYDVEYTPMSMGHMMGMMHMDMQGMMEMMSNLEGMEDLEGMSMMEMMHMMNEMGMMGGMNGDNSGMGDMGNHDANHPDNADAPRHDHPMMMGMMAGFSDLVGVEYEAAWLESMIDHHDGAVHMSENLIAHHSDAHPELLEFAQGIIDAQTLEIEQMETMISELEIAQ